MKSKTIYIPALLLMIIMFVTAIMPINVVAAEVTMDLSKAEVSQEYTLNDADGNVFKAYYGLQEEDNPFGYEIKPRERKMHDYIAVSPTAPESKDDWVYGQDYLYCFCIEHGVPLPDDSNYSGSTDLTHGNKYEQLSENQKTLLSLALAYGYTNRTDLETSKDANACYSATQLIVWQITLGFRTSATELNDKTYPMDGYEGTMTEQYTSNAHLKDYYDRILSDMASHYKRPSFTSNVPATARSYEMQYANGKYSVTLTDTNNVLSKYKVTSNGGATVSISGNKLTISSTTPITSDITIKLNRKMPKTTHTSGFIICSVAGNEEDNQDMVSGVPANNDPVPSYLKVTAPAGSTKIVKTSEDGKVSGVQFTITGNGVNKTVTTGTNGEITVPNLSAGTYTVTEVVGNIYEPQESRTVTVVAGQTATVTFNNTLKRGDLVVTKTSEDGLNNGVKFRLYGTASNGLSVNEYAVTDSSGKAYFNDVLIGSSYTLEEVDTENYYITPVPQTVTIEWNKVMNKSVNNVLKTGELKVTKIAEDGLKSGIKFHLSGTSDSGIKVNLYATTNANGIAEFKDVLIGSNYTLEEVDTKAYYITPVPQTVTIEWNKVTNKSVNNTLKRGDLKVTKSAEDGLKSGIKFYLSGTSDSGIKVNLYATTNANGIAEFKDVLVGSGYTLEEVDTKAYYITPIPQTVTIEWNKVTNKSVTNTLKRGDLKVTKSAEDGLVSGIKFHLYGTSNSGTKVDVYTTTNSKGIAEFNDVLIGSGYTLEEVDTKAYYITPVPQTVTIEWNKVTNKSVTNILKRGDLVVTKTSDDNFVKDVTFRLYGTAANGEAVDITAKTDSSGKAYFNDVLIGSNYTLEEVGTKEYYITPVTQTGVNIKWDEVTNKTVHNELKTGNLTVTKTSEDGLVSGVKFHLYGTSDSGIKVDEYATTNSNGIAEFKDIYIGSNYTLEEVDAKAYYVTPVKQTGVEIEWNKVTNRSFENTLKRGDLKVIKTSEDDMVEGVKFHLVGTSDSGIKIDMYAITDKNGVAVFEDILVGKNYTLSEVDTEFKYITPVSQSTTIEWNKVTEKDFYNELKRGDLTVTKTSEDKLVEGITFRLYGTAECGQYVDVYATTDKSGKAYFKDVLIGSAYTLEEVNTADKYITSIPQEVTIEWNKVTEKSVYNELKRGDLTVTKTAEDGLSEGLTFHLYGYSLSGIYVDEYATTDENGIAEFKDILIGSNYTLEEYNCPERYVVPELQEAAIEWNKVTNKSFDNILKKWNAEVYKVDSEYDKPQGDATLEGAVYGVYKGDILVDKYTTDENGYFVTKYYPCSDDWTISEISPSKGYLLDETVYEVGAECNKYTVELNTEQFTLKETVIKGSISIIKHCDDGSTQIETPEVGAEFQIFLASALSYDNAKETERDILICDEHGYAKTKDLPFGNYTVKQTKGWDGRDLMPEFTVVIDENGKVYRYLINNSVFESFVKIVKVDAETGNTIPYAGAGFKIYDPNGKLVTMTLTYPEVVTIDTFYTSEDGYLITPESLEYGEGYYLIEVQAPVGYVLDTTPVYFDITEANSTLEDAVTVIQVTKENTAQKGIIKITKSGEVFSSVIEKDGMYQPVYSISGLAGAVYEITAAEDIITLDGTVRHTKGEVVDTITTDENGYAESKPLYLGKFIVREITAPFGMVLNTEPVTVELTYAGQEVEITDTSASFVNERQKISIDLIKSMEKDELFGIGSNDEVLSVQFALYAAKDIIAADGTMIPKGALIEIASCDIDGKLTFNTDMPVGSVVIIKEYATDEHYVLFDGEFLVIFDYAGQGEKIVHVTLNDCADITNEIIRGTVIGKKVDEDGFTIAGALFGLFYPDETVFTEETALMLSESNEIGIFGFENVPYGNWIIRELRPASAFVPNEELYEVNIAEDEQFIEITIENKFITGSVTTTKVDKEYPDNKLSGAIFEIYVDVDGNGEFDANIDTLLGEMTETETGVYLYEQLRYGGYFLYEKSAPEGYIKDNGYYYFEIQTNGETVTVENEAGLGFINNPKLANLKIVKTSTDGRVEGFSFRVTNEKYGYDEIFTTDENGEILIEDLKVGIYIVSEVEDEASDGYILPNPVELELVPEETLIVEMHNDKPPQAGDNSNILLWTALMLMSLGGIIGMFAHTRRKIGSKY